MKKLILCIIGMPGAGKTTVADMIKKNLSACSFESGDVIRDEIRRRKLRYTKENDRKISEWFHEGREHLIIERIARKIRACNKRIIIVSGFFAPEEIKMLKMVGKIVLIAVDAPSKVRYRRQMLRKRFKGQTNRYLQERDRREVREGIGKLLKNAEYRISSNTSKKELEKKIILLVGRILKKERMT